MNQLARGEAPYGGNRFWGLPGGASALVDALIRPHVIVAAQCDEKFIQRTWISMLWIGQ